MPEGTRISIILQIPDPPDSGGHRWKLAEVRTRTYRYVCVHCDEEQADGGWHTPVCRGAK